LVKNSFTLLETIISLIIVSFLIGTFFKIIQDNPSMETYINLQNQQNNINIKK